MLHEADNIYEQEPDAAWATPLGPFGRCYLTVWPPTISRHWLFYPVRIRHFKQKIVDGWQERADNWLPGGGVWLKSHPDQAGGAL
ncbi:MAG: hypothetical protein ACLSWY_06605 [Ruthenibacterium lactatiformans]